MAKDWAEITRLSKDSPEIFSEKVGCQTSYFKRPEHTGSIYHNCAAKGIDEGTKFWYKTVRDDAEYAKMKEKLQVQRNVNTLVRRLWRELIASKGKERQVMIDGQQVQIPAGLGIPKPEGVMLENHVVPGYRSASAKEELPNQQTFTSQESFYEASNKELEQNDSKFHRKLTEDPAERCQRNRVHNLYQELKSNLASCSSLEDFKTRARTITTDSTVTLDELELLDRVLFDIEMACGITQKAVKIQTSNQRSSLLGLARTDIPIDTKSTLML